MMPREGAGTRIGGRLVLGTAQFGSCYGLSNDTGQVGKTEVAKILGLAHDELVVGKSFKYVTRTKMIAI